MAAFSTAFTIGLSTAFRCLLVENHDMILERGCQFGSQLTAQHAEDSCSPTTCMPHQCRKPWLPSVIPHSETVSIQLFVITHIIDSCSASSPTHGFNSIISSFVTVRSHPLSRLSSKHGDGNDSSRACGNTCWQTSARNSS